MEMKGHHLEGQEDRELLVEREVRKGSYMSG